MALALRRLSPDGFDYVVRGPETRSTTPDPTDAAMSSNTRVVEAYEELSAQEMRGYSTVITLLGTTQNSPERMMAVNAALPLHLAEQAALAGVTHFIALSSFSVFGDATRISKDTPLCPASAYGKSRLAGEENVARFADRMACTIVRCPILYGAGDSKLERLIALWCRVGMFPAPSKPVYRSMVHYDLAARYLAEIAGSQPRTLGLTIDHLADPVAFEYRMTQRILSSSSGKRKRILTVPSIGLSLFSRLAPQMARSLYSDSLLEPANNYFKALADSRIERDLACMAGAPEDIA